MPAFLTAAAAAAVRFLLNDLPSVITMATLGAFTLSPLKPPPISSKSRALSVSVLPVENSYI